MSYIVEGVDVAFARRDITQATDREIEQIVALIKTEKHLAGPDRIISDMVIESDYLDDFNVRYRLSTIVSGTGDDPAEFDSST